MISALELKEDWRVYKFWVKKERSCQDEYEPDVMERRRQMVCSGFFSRHHWCSVPYVLDPREFTHTVGDSFLYTDRCPHQALFSLLHCLRGEQCSAASKRQVRSKNVKMCVFGEASIHTPWAKGAGTYVAENWSTLLPFPGDYGALPLVLSAVIHSSFSLSWLNFLLGFGFHSYLTWGLVSGSLGGTLQQSSGTKSDTHDLSLHTSPGRPPALSSILSDLRGNQLLAVPKCAGWLVPQVLRLCSAHSTTGVSAKIP